MDWTVRGPLRRSAAIGRVMALLAVIVAAVVVVVVLLGGSDPYAVKVRFANASQLVKGNLVQVAGTPVGTVTDIDLTDNGQAEVTLEIRERPRRCAAGRRDGPPGVAVGRRQPLRRPAAARRATPPEIADGATIGTDEHDVAPSTSTSSSTPSTRDTRESLQEVIQGSARPVPRRARGAREQRRPACAT